MASRKEQKERLRRERVEREEAERRAADRRRKLRGVASIALAVAAVAAVAVAIAASGGGGSGGAGGGGQSDVPDVPVPKAKIAELESAAAAAKCTLRTFPDYGAQHTEKPVQYKTNPPTSGPHLPVPASDGIYGRGATPPTGKLVHAMEHGRIEIQYRPGTPVRLIGQLQSLYKEPYGEAPGGSFTLLFENKTGMQPAIAATAWTQMLACPKANDQTFDALRAFRTAYFLKGPEVITQPE